MGKPTICIGGNEGANQLRSNCEADQHLCFRYMYSTIPLLLKSEISSFYPSSGAAQAGLCWTWSETRRPVFSRRGSYNDPSSQSDIQASNHFLRLNSLVCVGPG